VRVTAHTHVPQSLALLLAPLLPESIAPRHGASLLPLVVCPPRQLQIQGMSIVCSA
jgi:hypothetical protein